MYIRLHSEGMLTDVHNWLRCLFVVSKVCKGNKKKDTPKGVLLFGFAAGFENKIQAAGGSLVDAGWTASKPIFSAKQKMQTNPFYSAPPNRQ